MEYGKNESFVSVSAHLYWKVSGKESCCVQGNPCCHIILSAVSLTACLTCIVLALVTEQLHRCDCSVFVPISGKVLVSSVPNRNCEWCGFWSVWCPSVWMGMQSVTGSTVAAEHVMELLLEYIHFCWHISVHNIQKLERIQWRRKTSFAACETMRAQSILLEWKKVKEWIYQYIYKYTTRQKSCAGVLLSVRDRHDYILDGWKPKLY